MFYSINLVIQILMYNHIGQPFLKPLTYKISDCLFLLFSILYMIGDPDHNNITIFRMVKPFPVWLMMFQLFSLRNTHRSIFKIIIALGFGSLGDILLEVSGSSFVLFAGGAASFLVGHLIYVVSFLQIAEDVAANRQSIGFVLSKKWLYILIWVIVISVSFWSISLMVKSLDTGNQIMNYVLPVYGCFLVMLVMSGCFLFFTTSNLSNWIFKSGLFIMIGAIVFYVSDSLLAHGKFNQPYKLIVDKSLNSYLIMITYYIAQFCIGKGGFCISVYFSNKEGTDPMVGGDQLHQMPQQSGGLS